MNLHLLHTGPLSVNTYIVPLCGNKVFVLDPADCPFSRDEGSVLSFLSSKKMEPVAVILTHSHFDHVSGLPSLKKAFPSLPIVIHEDDSAMIGPDSSLLQGKALSQMGFDEFLPFVSSLPKADFFLKDKKTLAQILESCNLSGDLLSALSEWEVLHTPGHTPGSCCLYNERECTLLSGDTIFYHSWGRTDLIGGNEAQIHQSLLKVFRYCDEESRVYSGHDGGAFLLGENF